jgi:hypothetical protein
MMLVLVFFSEHSCAPMSHKEQANQQEKQVRTFPLDKNVRSFCFVG